MEIVSDYEILKLAHSLITTAITEEGIFGEGIGANFIVVDNARKMVTEYLLACATGKINNEPITI
jgi:hypothetical protein